MARKTVTLLPQTGSLELDTTGNAVPGDSYYGYTDGIHTVAIYGQALSGRVKIQGTLATNPTEDDWFDILFSGLPYKDYTNFTGVEGFTFVANLVYLRASLDRTSLGISDFTQAGYVEKIFLNY
ncbi:MAG: hypothetical protein CMD92_08335 [Gammaproteobacteria bacterium]|nr:hypothetical protein [Gammaproteobacteria bacterium]